MLFTFFLFFSFLPHIAVASCPTSICNSSNQYSIRFPFSLSNQSPPGCGFPGFDLSCNSQNQTIITLPSSGDFSVDSIDYGYQTLFINDLEKCLTKRFFEKDFSLAGSPFMFSYDSLDDFTFLNCSSKNTVLHDIPPVSCLDDDYVSYMVIAVPRSAVPADHYGCSVISTALAPKHLDLGVELTWDKPDCSLCENKALLCGLEHGKSSSIRCSSLSTETVSGDLSSRATKFGLVLGAGILVVLFILCLCVWSRSQPPAHHH